jgi:hypothetical protein
VLGPEAAIERHARHAGVRDDRVDADALYAFRLKQLICRREQSLARRAELLDLCHGGGEGLLGRLDSFNIDYGLEYFQKAALIHIKNREFVGRPITLALLSRNFQYDF